MSIYSEFHVEFNGYSPMNRNDPQQVEIFGPASLKNLSTKAVAEFSSTFSLRAVFKKKMNEFFMLECNEIGEM